jgi:hypothetical protein
MDPPIKNGEYAWWKGDLGQERDSKTGKLRLGKHWYILARSYSEWYQPTTYNEWTGKWRLKKLSSSMDLSPAKAAQWDAGYGKALVKHLKLKVTSSVCIKAVTTETQTTIGFTIGTENTGGLSQSYTTKAKWECVDYKRTLGKGVKPSLESGVSWINAECLNSCSARYYRHTTTGTLTLTFVGKDKETHEEEVRADLACEVMRIPPEAFGDSRGSFGYPDCTKGGTLTRPILED